MPVTKSINYFLRDVESLQHWQFQQKNMRKTSTKTVLEKMFMFYNLETLSEKVWYTKVQGFLTVMDGFTWWILFFFASTPFVSNKHVRHFFLVPQVLGILTTFIPNISLMEACVTDWKPLQRSILYLNCDLIKALANSHACLKESFELSFGNWSLLSKVTTEAFTQATYNIYQKVQMTHYNNFPSNSYLYKISNKNTRKMCEIFSTSMTSFWCFCC